MVDKSAHDRQALEEIKDFYDGTYHKEGSCVRPARYDFKLARKLGVREGQQVLDVACGKGAWLQACEKAGAQVCGVDLSENAISACIRSMPGGEFFAQPAETLPFEDRRFDLVTCLGSLEHFLLPERALKEMLRVTRDDGTVVILVPNSGFLTRRMRIFKGTYQVDAREVVRSLSEWDRLFTDAGLDVRDRWKDLHVMSWGWIRLGKPYQIPLRLLQALALPLWPLEWQYQVFHLCRKKGALAQGRG